MNQEARELMSFMKAVEKDPRDVTLRRVFADWLEEHDEPEEARVHREFDLAVYDAQRYLKDWCKRHNPDREGYEELLEAIREGDGYCFSDDDGPYSTGDPEFRKHVEVLLKQEVDWEQPFRCAC